MKNAWFPIPIIIGVAALAAACGGGDAGKTPSPTVGSPAASPSPTPQLATPTLTPEAGACQPNPDPGTPDVIRVDTPAARQYVSTPVTVSGKIASFEGNVRITIFATTGEVIADVTGQAAEGQVLSPYSVDVAYAVGRQTPACLWVYENSARDGSPIHVVQVPVTLLP